MQKYRPVSVFLGIHQYHALRVLAEATRKVTNPAQQAFSVSKLVRLAVTRLIQDLEEWDDAVKYLQSAHKPMREARPTLNGLARAVEQSESA